MGRSQLLLEAKALRLQYCLNTKDEGNDEHNKMWLIHFLNQSRNTEKSLALKKIQITRNRVEKRTVKDDANQEKLEFILSKLAWAVRAKIGGQEYSSQAADLKGKEIGTFGKLYGKAKEQR
ncbi:Patched Domain-Containing Protein 3 [Manis pentadactyla]|nr:Patched Domain-Containing Protein 3 [Manis pentadactyla]